jgi:rsbT co-antagonist protein RsbR
MTVTTKPTHMVEPQVAVSRAALVESGMLQSLPLRVLDDTPLGVIIWDRDFRVAEWNKAAGRIFGWEREQAYNQHASFIVPMPYRPLVDDIFRSLLLASGGTHSVNDNVRRDGVMISCEWHNTPLRRDDQTVVGVISLVHDITERQGLEAELRRVAVEREARIAEAQSEAEQKSKLLAELNTQLATIQRQTQQIVALSAPLLDVWEGVLAVPLSGSLDSLRIAEIMERLLGAVTNRRVQFVILDLTGVDNLDTSNAAQLIKLMSALGLLGAKGIVTGIHPVVAQILVRLGVELRNIVTLRSLQEALRFCMGQDTASPATPSQKS